MNASVIKQIDRSTISNLKVALASSMVLLILILRVLDKHGWDPTAFILLTPNDIPDDQTWGVGYDGRFSYHIAVNPLGSTIGLDEPNYRYQRILYPLLVKILSLGNPASAPLVMLIINWLASIVLSFSFSALLAKRGVSPWFSLVLVFSIGYLFALRMDLLEPLALALAVLGWLSYEQGKHRSAMLFFAFSGLTKEIGLVFPVAIGAWLCVRQQIKPAFWITLTGLLPYVIWFIFLSQVFGIPEAAREKSAFLWPPYSGLQNLSYLPSLVIVSLWTLIPSIVFGAWAILDMFYHGIGQMKNPDQILVILQAFLIGILPQPTWVDPLAVLRFNLGLIIAVLLWSARSHPRILPFTLGLWLPSGLVLFLISGM